MYSCEVCGIEIDAPGMCRTCELFMNDIAQKHESELIFLRRSYEKLKVRYKQIEKERDILIHRILHFNKPFCPHSTEMITNFPKEYPELLNHCKEIESCHKCWYAWIKKEASECDDRICGHCPHRCIINQKVPKIINK